MTALTTIIIAFGKLTPQFAAVSCTANRAKNVYIWLIALVHLDFYADLDPV